MYKREDSKPKEPPWTLTYDAVEELRPTPLLLLGLRLRCPEGGQAVPCVVQYPGVLREEEGKGKGGDECRGLSDALTSN